MLFSFSEYRSDIDPMDLSAEAAKRRMEKVFRENASKPLFSGFVVRLFPWDLLDTTLQRHQYETPDVLPHVYSSSSLSQNSMLSSTGHKYLLPLGTERKYYEVRPVNTRQPVS